VPALCAGLAVCCVFAARLHAEDRPAGDAEKAGGVVLETLLEGARRANLGRRYEEAKRLYGAALKHDDGHLDALYGYAYACEKLGEMKEAVAYYRRFVEACDGAKEADAGEAGADVTASELRRRATRARLLLLRADKAGNAMRVMMKRHLAEWEAFLKRSAQELSERDRQRASDVVQALGGEPPRAAGPDAAAEPGGGKSQKLYRLLAGQRWVSYDGELWRQDVTAHCEVRAARDHVVVENKYKGFRFVFLPLPVRCEEGLEVRVAMKAQGLVRLSLMDGTGADANESLACPEGRGAILEVRCGDPAVWALDGQRATSRTYGTPRRVRVGLMLGEWARCEVHALSIRRRE
jgi:hypothetical protein